MKPLITVLLILLLSVQLRAEEPDLYELAKANLSQSGMKKMSATPGLAEQIYKLYFPESPDKCLKMLGHAKVSRRKWATRLLKCFPKFKAEIQKTAEASDDPEVVERCEEILSTLEVGELLPSDAVLFILAACTHEYSGKSKFNQFYLRKFPLLNKDIQVLLNRVLQSRAEIEVERFHDILKLELDSKIVQQIYSFVKKEAPDKADIIISRSEARNLNFDFKKIMEDDFGAGEEMALYRLEKIPGFVANQMMYTWACLDHYDPQVQNLGCYLIHGNALPYKSRIREIAISVMKNPQLMESLPYLGYLESTKLLFSGLEKEMIKSDEFHLVRKALRMIKETDDEMIELILMLDDHHHHALKYFYRRIKGTGLEQSLSQRLMEKFKKLTLHDSDELDALRIHLELLPPTGTHLANWWMNRINEVVANGQNHLIEMFLPMIEIDADLALVKNLSLSEYGDLSEEALVFYLKNCKTQRVQLFKYLKTKHSTIYGQEFIDLLNSPEIIVAIIDRSLDSVLSDLWKEEEEELYELLDWIESHDKLSLSLIKSPAHQNYIQDLLKSENDLKKLVGIYFANLCALDIKQFSGFLEELDSVGWTHELKTRVCTLMLAANCSQQSLKAYLQQLILLEQGSDLDFEDVFYWLLPVEFQQNQSRLLLELIQESKSVRNKMIWLVFLIDNDNKMKGLPSLIKEVLALAEPENARDFLSVTAYAKLEPVLTEVQVNKFYLAGDVFYLEAFLDLKKNCQIHHQLLGKLLQSKYADKPYFFIVNVSEKFAEHLVERLLQQMKSRNDVKRRNASSELYSMLHNYKAVIKQHEKTLIDFLKSEQETSTINYLTVLLASIHSEEAWPLIKSKYMKIKDPYTLRYFHCAAIILDKNDSATHLTVLKNLYEREELVDSELLVLLNKPEVDQWILSRLIDKKLGSWSWDMETGVILFINAKRHQEVVNKILQEHFQDDPEGDLLYFLEEIFPSDAQARFINQLIKQSRIKLTPYDRWRYMPK